MAVLHKLLNIREVILWVQAANTASLYGPPPAQQLAQQPAKTDNGTFSWLGAFQARQDALRVQAAGEPACLLSARSLPGRCC